MSIKYNKNINIFYIMSNVLKIRIHAYVSNNNKYLKNPEENDIEFINLPTDSVKITTDKGSVDKNKIKDVVNEVLKKNKFVGGKRYKRNTLKKESLYKPKNKSFKKYI